MKSFQELLQGIKKDILAYSKEELFNEYKLLMARHKEYNDIYSSLLFLFDMTNTAVDPNLKRVEELVKQVQAVMDCIEAELNRRGIIKLTDKDKTIVKWEPKKAIPPVPSITEILNSPLPSDLPKHGYLQNGV